MPGKLLISVVVALALLGGTYLLLSERQSPPADSSAGQLVFPGLEQRLNDINRIRVEYKGSIYEVIKSAGQWQLPGKGGYPVLFERVKPLLLGMALLEKFEPKTDKPENYARLGVQEPSADSANTRIALYANGDDPVASLIVGGISSGMIAGGRDGIYARVTGDARAWLLAGSLNLPQQQVDWVDREVIHITPKRVRRVAITHPGGGSLVIERPRQGAPEFNLANMPEGAVLKDGIELNALAMSLAGLKMDDVMVRAEAGLAEMEAVKAVFETWDGLQVRVYTVEQDERIFAWFEIDVAALDATDLRKMRTIQSDDAGLRARLDGWVYRIPRSRGDRLRTRIDEMTDSPGAADQG